MNALSPATLLASSSLSSFADDTELLSACATFSEVEARLYRPTGTVPDEEHVAALDRYHDAYHQVDVLRPTTLAGLQAKARVVASGLQMQEPHFAGDTVEDCAEWQVLGAWRLLQDVMVFDKPSVSPDAGLIAACNEYLRIQREFEGHFVSLPGDIEDDDPAWAILDPLPGLRDRIAGLRARTPNGYFARLSCMAFHHLPSADACRDDPEGATEDRFRAANLRDAVAVVRSDEHPTPAMNHAVHPDAELIAVCTEFDACNRQTCIIHGTGPDCVVDDDEANAVSGPIFARMGVLLDRMEDLRAATPAGIQARAHSLAQHGGHGGYSFDCGDSMVGRLLHMLMRDSAALGGSVGVVVRPPSPDAELLAVCAEFDALERAYLATFTGFKAGSPEEEAAEAEQERLRAVQEPLVDRICELRAVTREGQVARARSLALWDAELMKSQNDTGGWLTAAIVRDLIAGSATA